jgi:HAD superfamily hydrolase (TIGR01549 family)
MAIRDYGFRHIFREFDDDLVDAFIRYHRYNAGLSRYVKIRYFYEEMLKQPVSESKVQALASEFSKIMKEKLTTPEILIDETVDFIKDIYREVSLHIVSGSDEKELNFLCDALGLRQYFISVKGSPVPKNDLVSDIMKTYRYDPKRTLLIGDSINDYEAAKKSGLYFAGYNNDDLREVSDFYIEKMDRTVLKMGMR